MDQWLETRQLPVHFVTAAGLVFKDDKVLLIRSKKCGWEIPGGIIEQGEAVLVHHKLNFLQLCLSKFLSATLDFLAVATATPSEIYLAE